MKAQSILCVLLSLAGVSAASEGSADGASSVGLAQADLKFARDGAVFTISNESQGNRVLAFARAADGSLGEQLAYPTGGMGTGDSLGSQSALALTDDHRFLLAVDAGSNELSAFAVDGAELTLRD